MEDLELARGIEMNVEKPFTNINSNRMERTGHRAAPHQ